MSWKIWNYLRHHEQWFMNCLVRQFCLFTEISSIYNNKQTQSLLIFELQAKQGLRSNHRFTIESFWHNHRTFLLLSNIHQCRRKVWKYWGFRRACSLLKYGLWRFQTGDTKLERFLLKNQHTQRKLLNFEFWIDKINF